MLTTLYRHKALLRDLIVRELTHRSAGSGLGVFWTVLHPLLIIGLYFVVFGQLMVVRLGAESTRLDYFIYLCAGLLPWFSLQEAVHRSCSLFPSHAGLVKKVAFPPLLLVGQLVGSALVTLTVSMALFIGILTLSGRPPGLAIGLLLPAAFLLTLLTTGLVLGLSVLSVFSRDLEQLVPVATLLWFWLTPIVYDPGILPDAAARWLPLNPLLPILDLFRQAVGAEASSSPAPPFAWPGLVVMALTVTLGVFLFHSLVRDVADEI